MLIIIEELIVWNSHNDLTPYECAQLLESPRICAATGICTAFGIRANLRDYWNVHSQWDEHCHWSPYCHLDPHRHRIVDHHWNPHESSTDAQKLGVICLIFAFDKTTRQNMIQTQVSHISPVGHCQESQILDLLVCSCNQRPRSQRPRCSVVVDSQKIPKEASAL